MTLHLSFQGHELRIDGDYEPAEPRTMDYPGCRAAFTPYKVEDICGDGHEAPELNEEALGDECLAEIREGARIDAEERDFEMARELRMEREGA